jgi:ribonuclease HI
VVLVAPDGRREEKSVLLNVSGCNNEAELHALCAALDMTAAAGARRLLLRGDSDVALRYVRGPDTTQVVRQLLWIPRHRNREADRLSRQALGLPLGSAPVAHGRRRAR